MSRTLPSIALALAVAAAVPTPAEAQGEGMPPDVVMLEDGGMVRGTISELVPDVHVELVTLTGQVRRFDMATVRYAGPASEAPGSDGSGPRAAVQGSQTSRAEAQGLVTIHAEEARLVLRAPEPLAFHVATSAATGVVSTPAGGGLAMARGYERICTTPCEASLPVGTYTLAVARGNGMPVDASGPVHIPGDAQLDASYASKSGLRVAGWVLFIGGLVGGLALASFGLFQLEESCTRSGTCIDTFSPNWLLVGLGGGAAVVGSVVGLIFAFQRDSVDIQVSPM